MTPEKIFAYFYPNDLQDFSRRSRSEKLGGRLVGDHQLAKRRYCLGDPKLVSWSDTDQNSVRLQLALAAQYGLSGFIVDTYVGAQEDVVVKEMGAVLDHLNESAHEEGQLFASMFCLKLARAVVPIEAGYDEQFRWLDLSLLTAETIIDRLMELIPSGQYYSIDNKPYLSLYGLTRHPQGTDQKIQDFVSMLREYSLRKYKVDLFIVGVIQTPKDILRLSKMQLFDSFTQYAGLPDFEPIESFENMPDFRVASKAPDIQHYISQINVEVERWLALDKLQVQGFIPSVSVGWDASVRGVHTQGADTSGVYPLHPKIVDSTPDHFETALKKIYAYSLYMTGDLPAAYVPIFAWNEIGEDAALLPYLKENGSIDFSYLEKVKEFSQLLKLFKPRN